MPADAHLFRSPFNLDSDLGTTSVSGTIERGNLDLGGVISTTWSSFIQMAVESVAVEICTVHFKKCCH